MFEVAIHSKQQHLQAVLADRGLVLRRNGEKWEPVAPPSNGLSGPWIEIVPHGDGVSVQVSKDVVLNLPERVNEKSIVKLPIRFALDQVQFEIVDASELRVEKQKLIISLDQYEASADHKGPSELTLARWFEALSTLNHWKVDSNEFVQAALELVVDPLGFDAAFLVAFDESANTPVWQAVASHQPHPELGVWLDHEPLNRLLENPKIHFQPSTVDTEASCLRSAIAFAPRLKKNGSLMGAVVGVRYLHDKNSRNGIRPLEAQLLQLLVDSMNQEQIRQEQLEQAARRRKLLEQAFTPALATRIERDPQVLDGCRREVTVLFADLRDSSFLFQNESTQSANSGISPAQTYQILSEVMDALTAAVIQEEGLVIDYYGDGLAAMWNAPFDQPSHGEAACRTAIDMQRNLQQVAERWRATLGRSLSLGIGVATGPAQVGNVGSRWKLKYGARGRAVNLASRLEQVTKPLNTKIVVSGEIARRLSEVFQVDRLCRALVAGIDEGIELYRLATDQECFNSTAYAEVLSLYEAGMYEEAMQVVAKSCDESGPMVFLAEKISNLIETRPGRRHHDKTVEPRDRVISFA